MNNPQSLTDQNLYQLCRTYGARALEWRRKFTGLLPEVFKRKLYEKKGFGSIFVFAKKLAGLSEEQVRRVLSLEEKFREFPSLLALLVNGEVSVNKLVRVASIADSENQEFLAGQVQILSQGAVEILVRDEKWARENRGGRSERCYEKRNGLFEPENDANFVRAHKFLQSIPAASSGEKLQVQSQGFFDGETIRQVGRGECLHLSPEVHQKLLELQQKGLDLNQLLLEFLEKREEEISQRKEQIAEKILQKEQEKREEEGEFTEIKDYILETPSVVKGQVRPRVSVAVRKILHEEYGRKCSIKNCQKFATTIHHTQRFSLSGSHDPHYLAPLCKEHHELAHAIDVKYQEVKRLSRVG